MTEHTYQVRPGVAHEALNGEAIVINFTTGSYYSLDGTGGLAWDRLAQGPASATSLATAVTGGAPASDAFLESLMRFLEELEREGLVGRSSTPVEPAARASSSGNASASEPAPPVLKKYTDLEALLLLDPIHDVLPTGWPNAKPDA